MADIFEYRRGTEERIRWDLGYRGKPGDRYEPNNGTEGELFFEGWCYHCARDKVMNGEVRGEGTEDDWCPIVGASFRGEAKEWVYDKNGLPECTAFVPVGQPIPPPRDELTIDMFDDLNSKA